MTSPTNPDPTFLSSPDAFAIRQAFGRMPYGANLTPRELGPATVDDVVDALDHLAEILRGIAGDLDEDHRELVDLRRQRDAVRAFLGTDK